MTTKFHPTHEIVFTPAKGTPTTYLVHLDDGSAYTRDEWESETAADWEVRDGVWLHQGHATPGGANGTVSIYTADLADCDVREVVEGAESEPLALYSRESAVAHAIDTGHALHAYRDDRKVWSCDADGEWRHH